MAIEDRINEIKQYVGKDVWVYCMCEARHIYWEHIHRRDNPRAFVYMRFLDVYETDGHDIYVEANVIFKDELNDKDITLYALSSRVCCSIFDITLYHTVYTTEELFGEMVSVDNTKLINLANKGYWVMVRDKSQPHDEYMMYIRIRSIVDNYVTYDYINADMVDYCRGSTDADDAGIPPSEQVYRGHAYLNAFEIYEPLEILSDWEMKEVLADSDELQRKAFADELEDEDE
jgi:hypothetical protein